MNIPSDTPRHPLSHEALESQPVEILTGLIAQLENANAHLQQSNTTLHQEAVNTTDYSPEDCKQFRECIQENDDLIGRQSQTIARARSELQNRLGISASNPHYDLAKVVRDPPHVGPQTFLDVAQQNAQASSNAADETLTDPHGDVEVGVYL